MARWTTRPILTWPGKLTTYRTVSPFSASWDSTMNTLDRELHQLRAKEVVLQRAYREDQLRLDGEPRKDARTEHPGVILSFESKHGPLRFACDRFARWEDNVRAIALGLEALRKVDRYGITHGSEQYTGWQALPAAGFSREAAERFLETEGGFAIAVKKYHPDGTEPDPVKFSRLMDAKRVLAGSKVIAG